VCYRERHAADKKIFADILSLLVDPLDLVRQLQQLLKFN